MINGPLSYDVKITRGLNGQSTNVSSTGNSLDMSGFEGVMYVLHGSSLLEGGSTINFKLAGSTAASSDFVEYSTLTTLSQTSKMATGSFDYKILALDLYKPVKRYVRPVVAGCSSDIQGAYTITAIQYGSRTPGSTDLRDSTYCGQISTVIGATS